MQRLAVIIAALISLAGIARADLYPPESEIAACRAKGCEIKINDSLRRGPFDAQWWCVCPTKKDAAPVSADQDACLRALAPAAEDVRLATEAVDASCWGPDTVARCDVAETWLESARDRHAAALALCPAPVAREYVAPFESDVDPFETVAATSPEADPAWCAVFGTGCE